MRVLRIKCCAECPYFQQTNGFYRVWVCRHNNFRGGINSERRKNNISGKILKSGLYPIDASKRVAKGCPLEKE